MKKLRKLVLTMMVVCLFGSMAACGNRNGNEENTTENGAGSNNTTNKNDTDNKNNTNDKDNRDNTTNNGDNGDGVVNDVTDGVVDGAEDIVKMLWMMRQPEPMEMVIIMQKQQDSFE